MEFETIILKKEGHIATITINRPERLNAMNEKMAEELVSAVEDVGRDEEMRVLVLTGAGRAFCAGADFRPDEAGLKEWDKMSTTRDLYQGWKETRAGGQRSTLLLWELEKPTIAMVNGAAVGIGCDWALACDIRVGSEKSRFRAGFINLGLFPGATGGIWLWPRTLGIRAAEYLFTNDILEAEEAYRTGVLNRLVPVERLEEETMKLALKIANGAPVALRLGKLMLRRELGMDLRTTLDMGLSAQLVAMTTQDHVEGVAATREKREPRFRGR